MEVEARVEEEIPALCDYCYEKKVERAPDYHCVICGYNFCAEHRSAHRGECSSKLRGEMDWVECSVEDCFKTATSFFRCSICERWFCREHREQHIEEELDKAEVEVEEG